MGEKSHCEINAFTISCWPQLLAPNYCNVLFPAQQLWVFSYNALRVWRTPDKRSETKFLHTESLQILQIHSSMTVLLLFSSPHSSSTGFRSEDRDSNGKRFILCSVTHFCVYFDVCFGLLSWWKIQTRPIIRFLTEAVRFWFFICWYLIESMMPCIWTRCSGPLAEKQAHNIKDPAVYLTVDMGYFFIPVCTKLIWWVCCQKALFSVSSDNRSHCYLKFQSCLTTEFAGVCFWMSEDNFSWNPPEQHVVI